MVNQTRQTEKKLKLAIEESKKTAVAAKVKIERVAPIAPRLGSSSGTSSAVWITKKVKKTKKAKKASTVTDDNDLERMTMDMDTNMATEPTDLERPLTTISDTTTAAAKNPKQKKRVEMRAEELEQEESARKQVMRQMKASKTDRMMAGGSGNLSKTVKRPAAIEKAAEVATAKPIPSRNGKQPANNSKNKKKRTPVTNNSSESENEVEVAPVAKKRRFAATKPGKRSLHKKVVQQPYEASTDEDERERQDDQMEVDMRMDMECEGSETEEVVQEAANEAPDAYDRSQEGQTTRQKAGHLLQPACECLMGCRDKLSPERRFAIWTKYWSHHREGRKMYMRSLITKVIGKHAGYHLPRGDGGNIKVCRKMFLGTLGYHPQNSSVIECLWENSDPREPVPSPSTRGKASPPDEMLVDRAAVMEFLESHHPQTPHYRITHAPNRRYMPCHLTVEGLHRSYLQSGAKECSYTSFLRIVKEMNLSFAKLHKEECATCAKLAEQGGEALTAHLKIAEGRRAEYRVHKAWPDRNTIYYSLDMQKVLQLPVMEQFKDNAFCPRLTCYNETMAPVGGPKRGRPVLAALWHDAIAGRSQDEVASSIIKMLQSPSLPEAENCVIWLDNCGGQNKNYKLVTTLFCAVKSGEIPFNQLTLNYFIPGHGGMSADSFHRQVNAEIGKAKVVLHFRDLVRCVDKAATHVNSIEMGWRDFLLLPRTAKDLYPGRVHFNDIQALQFSNNADAVLFRREVDQEWEEFDFMEDEFAATTLDSCEQFHRGPRGIRPERKKMMLKVLVPLMTTQPNGTSKARFWETLPTNELSTDVAPVPVEEA